MVGNSFHVLSQQYVVLYKLKMKLFQNPGKFDQDK